MRVLKATSRISKLSRRRAATDRIPTLSHRVNSGEPPVDSATVKPSPKRRSKSENKDDLVSFLRDVRQHRDAHNDRDNEDVPLPEALPTILKRSVALIEKYKSRKKQRNGSNVDGSAEFIRALAHVLQSVLHTRTANNHRVLGLMQGATMEEVCQHYHWLRQIFSFDEADDAQHRSILRITEAYVALRSPMPPDPAKPLPVTIPTPKNHDIGIHSPVCCVTDSPVEARFTGPNMSVLSGNEHSSRGLRAVKSIRNGIQNLKGLSNPRLVIIFPIVCLITVGVAADRWFTRNTPSPLRNGSATQVMQSLQEDTPSAAVLAKNIEPFNVSDIDSDEHSVENTITTHNKPLIAKAQGLREGASVNMVKPTHSKNEALPVELGRPTQNTGTDKVGEANTPNANAASTIDLKQNTTTSKKTGKGNKAAFLAKRPPRAVRKFAAMLEKAEKQLDESKLTQPRGNNAFETYRKILIADPDNSAATAGLQEIVERYRQRAERHIQQREYQAAFTYITRGLTVMPDHDALQELLNETAEKVIQTTVKTSPTSRKTNEK